MTDFRRTVALLLLMFWPGGVLYWFSVHPFVRFWRKIGLVPTMIFHYGFIATLACVVYFCRGTLLARDFGLNRLLVGMALPLIAASVVLRISISKHLKRRILEGYPEIAPDRYKTPLLTSGIYAHIRHPRYVEVVLVVLAFALIVNYLAMYALVAFTIVCLAVIIPLEERELRQRFGAEYEAYAARVPRFIPRRTH